MSARNPKAANDQLTCGRLADNSTQTLTKALQKPHWPFLLGALDGLHEEARDAIVQAIPEPLPGSSQPRDDAVNLLFLPHGFVAVPARHVVEAPRQAMRVDARRLEPRAHDPRDALPRAQRHSSVWVLRGPLGGACIGACPQRVALAPARRRWAGKRAGRV